MKLKTLVIGGSGLFLMVFSLLLFVAILFSDEQDSGISNIHYGGVNVSAEVLAHKPMVEKYAKEYGVEEYVNILLAIIQVESGGTAEDVMQSSESLGLPPNSLSTEESIKQGVKYFSELLASSERLSVDLESVIQSYNYGGGFLGYVANRGNKYTFELAQSFSKEYSGGEKVSYPNPIAIPINGGWRYNYGNMFYEFNVTYSVDQLITEGENTKTVHSAYIVSVYVDGSGNMVLVKNPTITNIPKKSSYKPKAIESEGTVDSITTNEINEFLTTFFKLYPTATASELSYYVNDGILKPIGKEYIFQELVNPIHNRKDNQVTVSLTVEYIDQQTKATQVSQFDLVLEKNGSNWKIIE